MSGSYGYVSAEGVGIDVAKLRCVTLLILIEVGHIGICRNPLCVQVQAGHQNLSRIGGLASCVGIPAAELITVPSRETGLGIVERRIVGAGLGAVVIGCICTEVRMVGNVDCNVLDVAVNMDIQLVVLHALILDGVPYDLDVVYVEVVAQNRGIGQGIIVGAVFIPVARSKETEVGRNFQIGLGNTVYGISNRVAYLRNYVHAFLGERTNIAGALVKVGYAAVRLAARQVEFFALIIVVLRSAARRQKYEILSRGLGLRLDRGTVGSPLCVQIQAGHQRSRLIFFGAVLIGVPAVEVESGRDGERVITNGICLTARCRNFLESLFHTGDSILCIVGMISNLNRNTGYIAVNMIAVCQPLNGVPYNCNIIYIKVFAQYRERIRGLGLLVVFFAIFRPVVRSEETEVFRRIQIFAFNAINLGITVRGIEDAVIVISNLLAFRSQMAFVAGGKGASGNAAVRSQIRQVVCSALAFAARWLITVWQKYEVVGFRIPIRCEVDVQRCHADFIFRRVVYYIIVLRIVFRNFGNGGISAIARLRAVRTAVCAAFRRSRCGILTLGRLCLGHRRSGNSGSFSGVCCGSGINHRHCDFFVRRKSCDALIVGQIVGQRPARAHGQHHDSRKSSCEQTFARILF